MMVGMFALRAERDFTLNEDFMKAVRKVTRRILIRLRGGEFDTLAVLRSQRARSWNPSSIIKRSKDFKPSSQMEVFQGRCQFETVQKKRGGTKHKR